MRSKSTDCRMISVALGLGATILCCLNFSVVIESDPGFLVWKGWNTVVHKVIKREHESPQKCRMDDDFDNQPETTLQPTVALLQIFHRQVEPDTWWGLSAAICSTYAKRHGYEYVYARSTAVTFSNRTATTTNPPRTMHWARIPVLLWLLEHHNTAVQWWLYLDIDAMINPAAFRFPVEWIFEAMARDPGCVISKPAGKADLIFFSNIEQEPHMPCTGTFLASNTSAPSLSLWWNHPGSAYFDTNSGYDQQRVQELVYLEPNKFHSAVLDIRQLSANEPFAYIQHYTGLRIVSEDSLRRRIALSIIRTSILTATAATKTIRRIKARHTIQCKVDLSARWYPERGSRRVWCGR